MYRNGGSSYIITGQDRMWKEFSRKHTPRQPCVCRAKWNQSRDEPMSICKTAHQREKCHCKYFPRQSKYSVKTGFALKYVGQRGTCVYEK